MLAPRKLLQGPHIELAYSSLSHTTHKKEKKKGLKKDKPFVNSTQVKRAIQRNSLNETLREHFGQDSSTHGKLQFFGRVLPW